MDLRGRSLLKETDLNAEEFLFLTDLARQLRADKRRGVTGKRLAGRNIALIFEKTSTRTRSAFEVAAYDEGRQPPTAARDPFPWRRSAARWRSVPARSSDLQCEPCRTSW